MLCFPALDRCLAGWLQEEEEWQALLAKVEQLDQQQLTAAGAAPAGKHAGSGAAAAADADTAAAGEGAAEAEEQPCGDGGELAALQRVHGDLHRHLAMQVEGVCKLVGDVEEMVERANSSAQAMQVRACGWQGAAARLACASAAVGGQQEQQQFSDRPQCALAMQPPPALAAASPLAPHHLSPPTHPRMGTYCPSPHPVQAEYHAEKFRVFPHVNSPAHLIRQLVRPQAAGKPAPAAAAAAAASPQAAAAADKENAAAAAVEMA